MLVKTEAIVLRALKYGDAQLIVDLFTERMGCVTFIHRVKKTKHGRIGVQFFQPLTHLEIEYDALHNGRLPRLKEVRMVSPYLSIPFDALKLSISLFIAEFLYQCVKGEQASSALYQYVSTSVHWLDAATTGFANFHLVFMLHLTRFIGFYPNLEDDTGHDFFDLRNGVFTPNQPAHGDFIVPSEASKIRLLMRMNYDSMHVFSFTRQERNRCVEMILKFYRLHVPSFPELKSLSVLQVLFQ